MYWIYLAIFVLVILTPKLILDGRSIFREEDIESFLIFCFGAFGFMLYLAKEKALLRVFREKLHLQKQTNLITRDLSDSYSYIGEMNRKLDIVKEFIFRLPQTTAQVFHDGQGNIYTPLLEAVSQLAKTDHVVVCFVDIKKKITMKTLWKSRPESLPLLLKPEKLLAAKKFFWEEEEWIIVRSPKQARGVTAFLFFAKTRNHIEDEEVFRILVAEALLLYSVDRSVMEKNGTS